MSSIGTTHRGRWLSSQRRLTRSVASIAGLAAMLVLQASLAPPAQAGRIVLNNNEWTLSDQGYELAGTSNADAFVRNVTGFLDRDGTSGGKVLIYSGSASLTGSRLFNSLSSAGYDPVTSTAQALDETTLARYDAIFLNGEGFAAYDRVLTEYLKAGGGVYVAAAALSDSDGADAWNRLIADSGLALEASYELSSGEIAQASSPLFDGVERLYFGPSDALGREKNSTPEAGIRVSFTSDFGPGAIGIYAAPSVLPLTPDGAAVNPPGDSPSAGEIPAPNHVPLPGTALLLALGLAGIAVRLMRR
jgi:hypothetical protein